MAAASDPRTAGIRGAISLPRMSTYDAVTSDKDLHAACLEVFYARATEGQELEVGWLPIAEPRSVSWAIWGGPADADTR